MSKVNEHDIQIYRTLQRNLAFLDRGGEYKCMCDHCGKNPGTQYHEIVNRERTVGNFEARKLSFSRYICSILCADCHIFVVDAHNPRIALILLDNLIQRYGYETVYLAHAAVELALGRSSNIELPSSGDLNG